MEPCRSPICQVISGKKKAAALGVRTAALGMQGIPEEAVPERGGAEEKAGLTGEIGAVMTGLTEFKRELLQLHAIVSAALRACCGESTCCIFSSSCATMMVSEM